MLIKKAVYCLKVEALRSLQRKVEHPVFAFPLPHSI